MLLDLETEDVLGDPDEDDQTQATERFDAEIEAAGRGDWEALGLDPPAAPGGESVAYEPITADDFLNS